jgi:predicted O-linked N-acetylglucosamine transferase (SPINDLY family)
VAEPSDISSVRGAFQQAATDLQRGNYDDAIAAYQRVLDADPAHRDALNNLGALYLMLGRTGAAIECLTGLVEKHPGHAAGLCNLADAHRGRGDLKSAVNFYQRAIRARADFANAYRGLAIALLMTDRPFETIQSCARLLTLEPDHPIGLSLLVFAKMRICEWQGLSDLIDKIKALVDKGSGEIEPFVFAILPTACAEQDKCARQYSRARYGRAAPWRADPLGALDPTRRLNLGYLSFDFRQHATSTLVGGLFENHDRQNFQVHAYSYGRDDGSDLRQRIVRSVDNFVDISGVSYAEAASRIHQDKIDVLIDLMGYTTGGRPQIAALRPAPIQVNYLGYPGTMGANFIDYVIADKIVASPELQKYCAEKIVFLPRCWQANDRQRPDLKDGPTRAGEGLPEDAVVFCCFNNPYKLNARIFDVWLDILRAVPASVLWLLDSGQLAGRNLRRYAAQRGVDPRRLVSAPYRKHAEHLARHRLADIFLDTLPVNALTTASDALWMGLPLITCPGDTPTSRGASSLLHAVGLPELSCASLEAYKDLAIRLAQNPERRRELSQHLLESRLTSELFDAKGLVGALEAAYRQMWTLHARAEPPRSFDV